MRAIAMKRMQAEIRVWRSPAGRGWTKISHAQLRMQALAMEVVWQVRVAGHRALTGRSDLACGFIWREKLIALGGTPQ